MSDPVNHPKHYTFGKFEVIDVIEDWQLGFCLGNALKYIARAGRKSDRRLEDLKKARWYLNREIGGNIEEAARAAHEANRWYCSTIGDDSQVPWEDAPQWQRDSAVAGVRFIRDNPDAGPEAQHECWLEIKRVKGWKYGPIKDPKKKEHPCFLPYNELPPEQRVKDVIFGAVVRGVLGVP